MTPSPSDALLSAPLNAVARTIGRRLVVGPAEWIRDATPAEAAAACAARALPLHALITLPLVTPERLPLAIAVAWLAFARDDETFRQFARRHGVAISTPTPEGSS